MKASKEDQYLSVVVDDMILPKSPLVELQTMKPASQQSQSLASVPAGDNKYVAINPVHVLHPAEVIKNKVVEVITQTTTGYTCIYIPVYIYIYTKCI